jgi:hypothetical protein
MTNNKNNTKGLQRQIAKELSKSEMWLIIRKDKDGIHLQMPNDDHLFLLCEFFYQSPIHFEMVSDFIKEVNQKTLN